MSNPDTNKQFEQVIATCRDLFAKKLKDYGAAWRIMRPSSVTDQIFIKANRIRSIETKGVTLVDEGIRAEFIGIVNYGIIALIQLSKGYAETVDMTPDEALELYDHYAHAALELMKAGGEDVNIKDVALKSGYNHIQSFYRNFTLIMETTPKAWLSKQ